MNRLSVGVFGRPSRSCQDQRCAQARSRSEAAHEFAVGAKHRDLDGAEHSGMLEDVMAAVHIVNQNRPQNMGQEQAQDAVRDTHQIDGGSPL